MSGVWKKKNQNNRGEIMLEALIVYPITIFLLFFILAFFSVLYQRWNLQIVANDTVTRVAQTYRFSTADEITGEISEEELTSVGHYRYAAEVFSHNMSESANTRADQYSSWRLAKTSYTKNVAEPECNVTVQSDSLGRRHLELTLTGSYCVPLGEALAYFGFDSTIKYEVSAYADVLDLADYMNTVDFAETQTTLQKFSGEIMGLIDSVFKLFDNLFDG